MNALQELPFSLPLDIDFLLFIYKAAGKTGRKQELYALRLREPCAEPKPCRFLQLSLVMY